MTAQERAKQHLTSQGRSYGKSGTAQKLAQNFLAQEEERKRQELEAYRDKVIETRQSHHFDIIQNDYGQSRYGRVGNITADDYSAANKGSYDPRRHFVGRGGADAPSASMTQLGAVAPQKMKADLAWRQYNRYKDMERYGLVSDSEPTATPIATRGNGPRVRSGAVMAEEHQRYEVPLTDTPSWMEEKAAPYMMAMPPEAAAHLNDPAEKYMRGISDHDLTYWYLNHADEQTKQDLRTLLSQSTAPGQVAAYVQTKIKPKADKYYADEYQRMLDEAYETAKSIEQDGDFMQGIREYWHAFLGGLSTSFGDTTVSGLVNQANMNRRSAEGKSNTGLEIATGIGGMTPSLLLSPLGPAAAAVGLGAQSMIRASREAIADGADNVEAGLYGALVGTTEALLSRFLGGISAFAGKTSLGSSIGNVITKAFSKVPRNVITKPLISLAVKTGKAIPEFIEEGLQSVISPALANITYGKEVDWENIPENMLHDGLLGAATAAVLNIAFSPVTRATRTASLTRADVENALPKPLAKAISQYEQSGSISDKAARRIEADLASQTALMALEPMEAIGITQGALDVIRATVAKIPKAKVVGASPTASVASVEANLANEQQNYDPDIDNIEDLSGVSKRARNAVRTVLNGKNIDGIQANQILSDPVAIKKIEYILGISLDSQKNKSVRRNQLMEAVKNYASYNVRPTAETETIGEDAEYWLMQLQAHNRISYKHALEIVNDPAAVKAINHEFGQILLNRDTAETKAAKLVALSKEQYYKFGNSPESRSGVQQRESAKTASTPVVEALQAKQPISGNQANKILADVDALRTAESILGVDTSTENTISGKRAVLVNASKKNAETVGADTDKLSVTSPSEMWKTDRMAGNTSPVYSLGEITRAASAIFGVQPRTDNMRSGAVAERNRFTGEVNVATANDVPAILHEFGHMIDRKTGISTLAPEAVKNEIISKFGMKDVYPEESWLSEGLAEFGREFMTNPDAAKAKYPQAYNYVMTKFAPNMKQALFEKLIPAVNAYMSASTEERFDAAHTTAKDRIGDSWLVRNFEPARMVRDWISEKTENFGDKWQVLVTDDLHGIKKAAKVTKNEELYKVYKQALNQRQGIRGRVNAALSRGLTDVDGNVIGPSMDSFFDPIKAELDKKYSKRTSREWKKAFKDSYDKFSEYLILKRAKDIKSRKDPEKQYRVYSDPTLDNLAEIDARLAKLEAEHPEFQTAAQTVWKYNDILLDMMVKSGMLSKEDAAKFRHENPHYVPFFREGKKGMDSFKGMVGSGRDIVNVFKSIAQNTETVIRRTAINDVKRAVADSITNTPDMAWFMSRNNSNPPVSRTLEEIEQAEQDGRLNVLSAYAQPLPNTEQDMGIYYDGKRVSFRVNDWALWQAFTAMHPKQASTGVRILRNLNSIFTATVTGLNLPWNIASNLVRDLQTLMHNSDDWKDLGKNIKNYVEAFKQSVKSYGDLSAEMQQFYNLGGQNGASQFTAELLKKGRQEVNLRNVFMKTGREGSDKFWGVAAKMILHPVTQIANFADALESKPRIAAYLTALENGASIQEAFYESQDVTTNFNRRGIASGKANYFIPFFNAGVQGLSKFYRYGTGYTEANQTGAQRAKKAAQHLAKSATAAVMLSSLEALSSMALFNSDEEEQKKIRDAYNRLSTYQKNNSWCFYFGNDKFITIKKPRELGILPSFIGRLAETIITDSEDEFFDFEGYAFEQLLPPLLDVLPVLASGAIRGDLDVKGTQVAGQAMSSFGLLGNVASTLTNLDYRGNPIVPDSFDGVEAKDRYDEQTTSVAKMLGEWLGIAPMKVDYALKSFGIIQDLNQAYFTEEDGGFWKKTGDFLIGNRFVKDSLYSNDITTMFYDGRTKAKQYAGSNKDDVLAQIESKEYEDMAKFYSAFRNLNKTEDPNDKDSRDAMLTVLEMLDEFNNEMENGNDTVVLDLLHEFSLEVAERDNSRKEGETEIGATSFYPATMSTAYKNQTLTSMQYWEYQTRYNDAYYQGVLEALLQGGSVEARVKRIRKAKEKAKQQADNYIEMILNGGK